MHITINARESYTDILDYMMTEETREMTLEDKHLSTLPDLILHIWHPQETEAQKDHPPYGSFRDEIAITVGLSSKEKE